MADRLPYRRNALWRLLTALLRDRAGNVLILATFMLIPLTALMGSAIDMSRVYVARSRMQQACDAASLAGRWAASGGQTTAQVQTEALKYFNFNFKQGQYGTATFTPVASVTGTSTKTVTITASTTMPMSIMTAFKFPAMTVAATCTAMQDFVNTDIVLVLDTTGSMDDKATSSDTQKKIEALRSAVLALYDQLAPIQTQLESAGMRLRYSIVPYSQTVNVGKLVRGINTSYIQTSSTYTTSYNCTSSSNGNCYAATGNQTTVAHDSTWFSNWNGCIEERKTTTAVTSTTSAIPAAAYDLDIDKVPTSDADTKWPPYDVGNQVIGKNGGGVCPKEAARLQTWTRANLQTYVNALTPSGATYHDIGMIWGGRMISSAGVFSDSTPTYNGMPTNRFVIFMTDGLLDTDQLAYSAYGTEYFDHRVVPSASLTDAEQLARHQQRFKLMCSAIKNKGVSVWVVAFASALDTNLSNCASNAGQASTSSNSADLITKFTEIGKNIGALRLTS